MIIDVVFTAGRVISAQLNTEEGDMILSLGALASSSPYVLIVQVGAELQVFKLIRRNAYRSLKIGKLLKSLTDFLKEKTGAIYTVLYWGSPSIVYDGKLRTLAINFMPLFKETGECSPLLLERSPIKSQGDLDVRELNQLINHLTFSPRSY